MRLLRSALVTAVVALSSCSAPQDGKPCTVKDNGDGTATISCPDGTTVNVSNGTNGTNGMNGSNGADGANGVNGTNGMNGTSCSVTTNPDAGTKTITCTDGTSVTLTDGVNGVDANAIVDFSKFTATELAAEDFTVTIQSVSNAPRPVVRFTVKTFKGAGVRNIPVDRFTGIALLQLVPGVPMTSGNGLGNDVWISHIANCATCTASSETASATSLVDLGTGSYQYTFVKDVVNPVAFDAGTGTPGSAVAGVAFDASAVHRFAMRFADPASDLSGTRTNPFKPVDATFDYVPATGLNVDGQNDKVSQANCLGCHTTFRANSLNVGGTPGFHGGQRYDVRYCVVCHNSQRKFAGSNIAGNAVIAEPTIDSNGNMTPPSGRTNISVVRGEAVLDLPIFIHKIHNGEGLFLKGNYAGLGTEMNEITFPQDIRNCARCHSGAAKADNWKMKPSRKACNSCHDQVNYVTGQGHGPLNIAAANDNTCALCHDENFISIKHRAIAKPDPANSLVTPGGSANTHASWVGNVNDIPDGGRALTYDLSSVTVTDGGAGYFPVVKFRMKEGDAGVVFNTFAAGVTTEMITGFAGSPSVYCVFAVPQDGEPQPADFNASMSLYLRSIWNGSGTGTGNGMLQGPDSQGYYTATFSSARVPFNATMLTCGLGYSYSLSSTPPLVQTDVPQFPYDAGSRAGGLSLPARNVWKVATGFTGRRGATASNVSAGQIVTSQKCAVCHNELGITPNYHAGQRNDAATCAFCHNPNKTSSAWAAGSGSFIHAIHAAKVRSVPFNWHAVAATEDHPFATGFWGIEYPARLNACETCHNPGMYDFSAPWYSNANVERRMMQTVATGTYNAVTPTADGGVPALALSISPYVNANGTVNYGGGFAFNVSTLATTPAASTNLVISPIANNCFGCHDGPMAQLHMEANGATIYGDRAQATMNTEQCLVCHGPGRIAAIKDVHNR